jgi:pimeloyl-ACP methyl ester carboxylesterase
VPRTGNSAAHREQCRAPAQTPIRASTAVAARDARSRRFSSPIFARSFADCRAAGAQGASTQVGYSRTVPPSRLLAPDGTAAAVVDFRHGPASLVAESFGEGAHTYVLLHGIGMGRSVFAELSSRLNGRIVGIDLAGFGEAAEPEVRLDMAAHADLVAAFLSAHDIADAVIIGHSMGCQVAMELAVRAPDRVGVLVLAGPTVDASARTLRQQAGRMLRDILRERPVVIWRGLREYVRGGPRVLGKIRAMLDHRPEDLGPRIHVPALVVRGSDDEVVPERWARRLAATMERGAYAEIPGFRHETMIFDAAPIVTLIDELVDDL